MQGGEFLLRTKGIHASRSVYGKAPMMQLHIMSLLSPEDLSGHNGNYTNSLKLSFVCKSASQAVFSNMQPNVYATRSTFDGVPRLVQPTDTRSVRTRRAPSRHCKDARVYGDTTTTKHDIEYIIREELGMYPLKTNRPGDIRKVNRQYQVCSKEHVKIEVATHS